MKRKITTLLGILGLSVFVVATGKMDVYAADQVEVNIDLDGGTLEGDYDLQLIHEETYEEDDFISSFTEKYYISVGQIRELGEPVKEGYTFIGWHNPNEVYTETGEGIPIEIKYSDYYKEWSEDNGVYYPRVTDESGEKMGSITLEAVYVPNLVIDAGDGAFADGSKTIEIEADPSQSDASKYVYFIPEENAPVYNGTIGVVEIESDDSEHDADQVEPGSYINLIPGETVKVVYRAADTENTSFVEDEEIFSEYEVDEEIKATATGNFFEVLKNVIVTIIRALVIMMILALLLWFIIWRLLRVEIKNNKSTNEYEENSFITVQKSLLRVEGNMFILLGKLVNKNNSEVWRVTIKDETLNNRESNEFILVLNKSFVKRFNGQQLVVKIGESDNAKTQGFTIDEQETEISLTVEP